jgi:hypothetical protein
MKERGSRRRTELPPELKDFLRTQEYAGLLHATNRGTVFVLKAPAAELATLRGPIPVRLTHELHSKRTAPVIRTMLSWYDRPDRPLVFEAFTNVADPQQAEDYLKLGKQKDILVLAYDESLQDPIQKRVTNQQQRAVLEILVLADKLRANIPEEEYDFDAAKAAVLARTSL